VILLGILSTSIGTIKLKNPTILASGIMDEDAGSMNRILDNHVGAVVTKSIGLYPREGHPNPTCIELEHGLLNAMGLPNPGINEFTKEIDDLNKNNHIIIGSIFGSNSDEFISLAQKMEESGVNAVELNLSCPHAQGYGLEIGQQPSLIKEITVAVKQQISIPVFVKLSSNVNDITKCAIAAEEGKADAIVAINTVKAMKIDINARIPVLGNKVGGYSGKAIKPIGVRCVYDIYKSISIPIIGCGGITTGEDAIEYVMAGATAIEIGSAIYYRDVDVFNKICNEMKQWMKNEKISSLSELIGVAHQ
jgi:dihydroorotate dehydrogenase (NAD+) catalytic subunit